MESALTDADCLARSLSEPKAFTPIFDRHLCRSQVSPSTRGRDLADELAAETFAVAFERRATCRTESALRGCTASRRTSCAAAGGPSVVNSARTLAAE